VNAIPYPILWHIADVSSALTAFGYLEPTSFCPSIRLFFLTEEPVTHNRSPFGEKHKDIFHPKQSHRKDRQNALQRQIANV
jgi:hypothetical protein